MLANTAGDGLVDLGSITTDYGDDGTWNVNAAYYRSLRLADINGDGYAELCGRKSTGVFCGSSRPPMYYSSSAVDLVSPWIFLDGEGWGAEQYGASVQFAHMDGDGNVDVCGRGSGSIWCGAST